MNTYEVERKLSDKADRQDMFGLQTEHRELRNYVNELETKIRQLESTTSNRYYTLERLFNMLAELPEFSELQDQIHELKCSL